MSDFLKSWWFFSIIIQQQQQHQNQSANLYSPLVINLDIRVDHRVKYEEAVRTRIGEERLRRAREKQRILRQLVELQQMEFFEMSRIPLCLECELQRVLRKRFRKS